MTPIPKNVLAEHGRIRELLQQVIACAAAVEESDEHADRVRLARAIEDLKRGLHQHSLAEGGLPGGGRLDDAHDEEDAAVIQLRCATDLEDILRHVGEIVRQLGTEEQLLQA